MVKNTNSGAVEKPWTVITKTQCSASKLSLLNVTFKALPETRQKYHLPHAKSIVLKNNKCETSELNCFLDIVLFLGTKTEVLFLY